MPYRAGGQSHKKSQIRAQIKGRNGSPSNEQLTASDTPTLHSSSHVARSIAFVLVSMTDCAARARPLGIALFTPNHLAIKPSGSK